MRYSELRERESGRFLRQEPRIPPDIQGMRSGKLCAFKVGRDR
jgi:hypothetical protein